MGEDRHNIDIHIGHKIKQRRNSLRLSQSELGKILGLSAQQIQRYESGENTVPLYRLMHIANALNVKIGHFIDDVAVNDDTIGQSQDEHIITKRLGRALRILLIEDDVNDVLLFQQAILKKNIDAALHHIQKPEEVMDFLNTHNTKFGKTYPDIIILDINMPRINGITLLKEIKKSPHKALPVIMLTNSIRVKDMTECYEQSASGFVQKSADLHEFYEDIERIVIYWADLVAIPQVA